LAASRTRFLIPHFILFSSPSVGDVTQLRLPDGMQSLNLSGYGFGQVKITGTCDEDIVLVMFIIYLIRFGGQPQHVLHSSFFLPFLLTSKNSLFPPSCHSTPPPPSPTLPTLTHRQTSGLRKGKDQGSLQRPVKNVHTLLSLSHTLTHTHTHTPRPSAAVVHMHPRLPIFRNTKRRSQQQPHFLCALSSYHRYWRIYLTVHTTRLPLQTSDRQL
jgi:hypothetical protein